MVHLGKHARPDSGLRVHPLYVLRREASDLVVRRYASCQALGLIQISSQPQLLPLSTVHIRPEYRQVVRLVGSQRGSHWPMLLSPCCQLQQKIRVLG